MAVSANTLFHFTQRNSLHGILASGGFYCQYSDEHFENILPAASIFRSTYIPMVSFCDLTITQLSNDPVHRQNFGEYGIGLTKEWGIKNRVSPVMYVHRLSQPTRQLHELIKMFRKYKRLDGESNTIGAVEDELIDSFKFIKPYKGRWHKGKLIRKGRKPVIYYNEREWRYCPAIGEFTVLSAIIKENEEEKEKLNQRLKNRMLKFSPQDIKFIIIKNKKDINAISTVIHSMDISDSQKNELVTKIITFEEINEDF